VTLRRTVDHRESDIATRASVSSDRGILSLADIGINTTSTKLLFQAAQRLIQVSPKVFDCLDAYA
jgi:hypothetical protein